ncbi:hypothetical protein BpHYR1_019652 [Brachionus plicatilis]|uniref:Uncharacterized protein n=1 Tax=Brachionus plicatilis TaxID=10195 RepID=A0A3M7Q6Z5_BRAPC|nr:hypothetical protein BpHYR1_019652 [Brachionus plicatilis]
MNLYTSAIKILNLYPNFSFDYAAPLTKLPAFGSCTKIKNKNTEIREKKLFGNFLLITVCQFKKLILNKLKSYLMNFARLYFPFKALDLINLPQINYFPLKL